MTRRVNWKTWGQLLTVVAAVGCEGNHSGNHSGPAAKAEPKADPAAPGDLPGAPSVPGTDPKVEPKLEPKLEPDAVVVGGKLDDRGVQSEQDGPWTRRRVDAAGGAGDYRTEGLDSIGKIGATKGGGGGLGGYGRGLGDEGSMGEASPPASAAPREEADPGSMDKKRAAPRPADSEMVPGGAPKPVKVDSPTAEKATPLKAGSTDDNVDFKGYLRFLTTWTGRDDVRGEFQPLDVEGRAFVHVLDGDGRPVPGALVEVLDADRDQRVWQATTYGDGRAPYYPRLFGVQQASSRLKVRATAGGESVEASWDGAKELTLRTAGPRGDRPMTLEVLFLIDTTGSMGDEIDQIKTSLLAVTSKAKARREDLVLRYGAVLYRDLNDDYLTMAHPFTEDLQAFNGALQAVTAGGGGDLPEALNQGLERAVEGMQWQADAAKVVFLICDAPPQMRVKGDVLYGDSALRAVGKGLRIHSVAASGLDPLGTLVLRQIAQLTRGKFIFIEYGGTQASAAKHGVGGPVQGGNNLDDILLAQISAEIDSWGR